MAVVEPLKNEKNLLERNKNGSKEEEQAKEELHQKRRDNITFTPYGQI